jgi:CBS domain-containing protein
VPRFHLNIRDGNNVVLDAEGADLPDVAAALDEARQCARELAIDRLRSAHPVNGRLIEVTADDGKIVGKVSIRDVLA